MLKDQFLGRKPSHFQINSVVKSFVYSEALIWPAWNFFAPILAIFIATKVIGGSIELAGIAYSAHLIFRVILELFSGKYLTGISDSKKIRTTIIGLIVISIAYIGFAFSKTIEDVFIFYCLTGAGFGIASPAKNALFSVHLDKNKECSEWAYYDAIVFISMALSASLGGFIAQIYGFQMLFILSSVINLFGIVPYLLILKK